MSSYRAWRFWSPTLGVEAVRLSMVDEHGAEFYMIVPADRGAREWRQERDRALDVIADAIDAGAQPGEVREFG
jgi:hypothetical protein